MLSGPLVNSCEPGAWALSIQSPQMPTEAEHKGKSSEEKVSPFHDPERDPIRARGAGWKDLDKNHRTGRTKGHTQFPWRDGKPIHRRVKKAVLESYNIPAVFLRSTGSLSVGVGTRAGADGVADVPSLPSLAHCNPRSLANASWSTPSRQHFHPGSRDLSEE